MLLYRCTALAESSPLLLESVDLRRKAVAAALEERLQMLTQRIRISLEEKVAKPFVGDGSMNVRIDTTVTGAAPLQCLRSSVGSPWRVAAEPR